MFVAFQKDVPNGPKAKDVLEFPDSIGRAYVDGGYATETDAMTVLRAEQAAMAASLEANLTKALTNAVKPSRPNPPSYARSNPDGSLQIEGVEGTTTGQGDLNQWGRKGKGPTPGDVTRMLYWAKAQDDERITESMQSYARKVMRRWDAEKQAEQTQWVDRSLDAVTDANPHGVMRDASESTQGAAVYGYLVRPEFMGDVFRVEAETDVMTNLREIPMGQSVEMRYPALDQYATSAQTRTSNYFGGVTLYRKPEDGSRTETDTKISEIIFKATDLTGMTKVSRDLLADSFIDLNGFLQNLFREAFGWRRDWDFINGTGVGEPQGIIGCACEIQVTRTTASHIRYEDIAKMKATMLPQALRGAYWIINAQASSEVESVLAASPSAFAYQPNTLISQAQWPSIYGTTMFEGILQGLPFKRTEKLPALGTARDLILFSPKYYGEATKAGIEIGLTEHRYWELDQVGIRWKLRNDGQPMMKKKFVGLDTNSYSPVVTLN